MVWLLGRKSQRKKKKEENRKELTKSQNKKKTYQLLELISNYNKVAWYKINVQKGMFRMFILSL